MTTKDFLITQILAGKDINPKFREIYLKSISRISHQKTAFNQTDAKVQTLFCALPKIPGIVSPEVEDILMRAKHELEALRDDMQDKQDAFEAYRCQHGLIALPKTPSSIETSLLCGGMVVVEAAVNASFFLNAHMSAGLLPALVTSTLISATNVVVSTCAGYFFGRKKNWGKNAENPDDKEFKALRRRANWLNRLYIAAIGGFHLTVALIRSQEELHRVVHGLSHYLDLLATPESYFLVLIGACMSVLSYHKGKTGFSDPYPLYGEMYAAVLDARDIYVDCQQDYAEEINERFDDAIDGISETFKNIASEFAAYNQVVSECIKADKATRDAVMEGEALLKATLSEIKSQQQSTPRRKKTNVNFEEMEALCDLSTSLSHQLPKHLSAPDSSSLISQLETARQRALARLASLSTTPQPNEE